jgi:hypothetical protein
LGFCFSDHQLWRAIRQTGKDNFEARLSLN